jgi:hypothetical protein
MKPGGRRTEAEERQSMTGLHSGRTGERKIDDHDLRSTIYFLSNPRAAAFRRSDLRWSTKRAPAHSKGNASA